MKNVLITNNHCQKIYIYIYISPLWLIAFSMLNSGEKECDQFCWVSRETKTVLKVNPRNSAAALVVNDEPIL